MVGWALAAATLGAGTADAAPPKIDPKLERALATGLLGAWHTRPPVGGRANVLVELDRAADAVAIEELRSAGARPIDVEGRPLAYERFVPLEVDAAAARALEALPGVARVMLLTAAGPPPLDHSAELLELDLGRGARPARDILTGEGVVIADIDTLADVFHPHFFRGDAGYFDWIDVDRDGAFTPGIDAIDLDRNGRAEPGEVAFALSAETLSSHGQPVPARPADFDPAEDWLYLDTNGNGTRDFGAAAGFDDSVPAFGEPLFVPDDVDRNGRLDPGERVVRLGTSKFRKAWVHVLYDAHVDHVFQRGIDLAQMKTSYTSPHVYGFSDSLHATGVLSILAGDVPLVGRRWVGMAPDAELVLAWDVSGEAGGLPASGVAWALGEKPDVMLHEISPWTGIPLDGTDPISKLIDASTEKDAVTHVCPVGDQAAARKHARAALEPDANVLLTLDVPSASKSGKGPLEYVDISLDGRGSKLRSVVLREPNGSEHDVVAAPIGKLSSGASYYATHETTPRGTDFEDIILYIGKSASAGPIPVGTWKLELAADAARAMTVDAFVSDDRSSFSLGAAWDPAIATDAETIGAPSTADHCIAVGAHPNHVAASSEPWFNVNYANYDVPAGYEDTQGGVRAYSPRGPRIDGALKPDVLAPDNPWAAATHDMGPAGSFFVFGGTSGAAPHAAGVAALLAEVGLRADGAREAIRKGARFDAATGRTPNARYGFGRLSAAGALGAATAAALPVVTLAAEPAATKVGGTVTLVPTVTDVRVDAKWDDGYDGTWDTPYAPLAVRTITLNEAGRHPFKIRVRNADGLVAEAVAWIEVGGAGRAPDDGEGCACRVGQAPRSRRAAAFVALALLAAARRRRRGPKLDHGEVAVEILRLVEERFQRNAAQTHGLERPPRVRRARRGAANRRLGRCRRARVGSPALRSR